MRPDARRSNVEPLGGADESFVVVAVEDFVFDDPLVDVALLFVVLDDLGVTFFSSTNRPRVFAVVAVDATFVRGSFVEGVETAAGAGVETGAGVGAGGGEGSCSMITASFERKRNGDRCRSVFKIPFDGRFCSDFLVVRSFVSKSISSSLK